MCPGISVVRRLATAHPGVTLPVPEPVMLVVTCGGLPLHMITPVPGTAASRLAVAVTWIRPAPDRLAVPRRVAAAVTRQPGQTASGVPPSCSAGGVLDDDALAGQLVADFVGLPEPARRPQLVPLLDEGGDPLVIAVTG